MPGAGGGGISIGALSVPPNIAARARRGAFLARAGGINAPVALGAPSGLSLGAPSLAAGLGAAFAGGALGVESALAPLLGWAAPLLIGLGLADLLSGGFAGRPKMLDTIQAVARLAQSRDPAIRQLARNIGIYAKNGVPISTSNPQQQAQLRQWIAGAIATALGERGLPGTPGNVGLLDKAIHNVLESQVANSGIRVDETLSQLARNRPAFQPAGQRGLPAAAPAPGNRVRTIPGAQPFDPPPGQTTNYLQRLGSRLLETIPPALQAGGSLVGGMVGELVGQPRVGEIVGGELGRSFGEQFIRQPVGNLLTLEQAKPPAPVLDTSKPCPECDRRISRQRAQLQREIRTETSQDVNQRLDQIQQQLDQLQQLENQPASQRDIARELEQKQDLARELDQLQQEADNPNVLPSQPALDIPPAQPNQPAPMLQQNQQEQQQQDEIAAKKFKQLSQQEQQQQGVQFCVGCQSMDDAVRFLNGEPAACSVIQGSTQPLNV